jgi:hypothetical protein
MSALIWMFCAGSLGAQELGRHFQKIRDGIYVYGVDDVAGRDPSSNCGIIITQEGVVLIDSGPNPPDSLAILKAVKQLTPLPIRFLINTETHTTTPPATSFSRRRLSSSAQPGPAPA